MPSSTGLPRLLAPLLSLAPLLACRTSDPEPWQGKPEPYVPLPDAGPETIGFFLTNIDRSLQQWNELKLGVSSARDQNMILALEVNLKERASKRRDELIVVLESGAPANRRIAAAALGFTQDPTVLGPLLASLQDRDPELVQKSLLALGVLALPETPLSEIRRLLAVAPEAWTRNNAAFVLLALASAGLRSSELAEASSGALGDAEPGVRAQCASTLGILAAPGAVEPLGRLLADPANLVSLAALAALAQIGRVRVEQKGQVARILAAELERAPPDRRDPVLGALRWVSQRDLGEDSRAWLEWATKLP